uniref:Inactive tyrosine-protein kinase PEAK1 n=1 Tax=Oryzias latipes TaxID=8090 RepID=A0A3P9JB71_ORYLA
MSACSDFAEHVWKPGSCKNCFHPLSAHKTVGGPGGSTPASCLKGSLGGDEEAGVTTPSPYSKPTIAVKPTMMSLDSCEPKDILNLTPLYIDSNVCNKAHREAVLQDPENKIDDNRISLSPSFSPKDTVIISNILVSQQEGRVSQSLKKNSNEGSCNNQENGVIPIRAKSAYNGSALNTRTNNETQEAFKEMPSEDNVASSPVQGTNGGSERSVSLQDSQSKTGPQSTPNSPNKQEGFEPIYAESTKKKRKPGAHVLQSPPQSPNQTKHPSEVDRFGENHKATITVIAAHTENNKTFYLSSPDSAVSTQCHFSPTARKDPGSPVFRWPSPSRSAPSLSMDASLPPSLSSPFSLPEFSKLGTSSLSSSVSCPVPLPELPMFFLVSAKEGHFKFPDNQNTPSERRPKPNQHGSGWSCRIEEEEEEEERGRKRMEKMKPPASLGTPSSATGSVSGAAVWKEARDTNTHSSPPAMTDLPTVSFLSGSRNAARMSCSSPLPRTPVPSAPCSPNPISCTSLKIQPPPLPEKKIVNRTVSAPDGGKPFVGAYPHLPFTGSESNVCRSVDASSRSSLPSSPADPRPIFSSNESRTLDEPLKNQGRLGVHCRTSITCSSSPQLSSPFSSTETGSAPNVGSSLQLQTLLSNIDSREGVYSKLGGLYAESLRRLALKCEDHFTRSQKNSLKFDESNWSLFRLTSNKPSCNAGDAVYYSAACALDPCNSYAVKLEKDCSCRNYTGWATSSLIPSHFNLQQDCGHFLACVPQSMLPPDEAALPSAPPPSAHQPTTPVQEGDRDRVVVITPDIPHQTAADFVREWGAFHKKQPEIYERRVCFLLLQLCNGLEHLKEHGVTHRDLCLENLLLVPHLRRSSHCKGGASADVQRHLPRLLISNFAKAKRRSPEDVCSTSGDPRIKRDHARLAPEIVSAAQYRKFDEFQTGILIYELLHQPNPFEVSPALKEQDYRSEDLPPVPPLSLYSSGLQRLAHLLLQPDPIKRIHIQEAKRILQSLLWGPRKDLMEQQLERHSQAGSLGDGSRHEGLLNWLDVKRALLMMKFAERSLEPERNAELEDWLCCQYFSSAHPLSLCHTAELLYSLK